MEGGGDSAKPYLTRRRMLSGALAGSAVVGAAFTAAACERANAHRASGATTGGPQSRVSRVTRARADGLATMLQPSAGPLELSRALLAEASVLVVAGRTDVAEGVALADRLHVPFLLDGPALPEEVHRLRTRTVVALGTAPRLPGVTVRAQRRGAAPPTLPGASAAAAAGGALVLTETGAALSPELGPVLRASGARIVHLTGTDPRIDHAVLSALRGAPRAPVVAFGPAEPEPGRFARRVRTARLAPELPGGGLLPFDGRRMVALYGNPQTPALGMLGEQGPAAAVRRVKALAGRYAALLGSPVVPAFEIIATVAAGSAGADGTYSTHTPMELITPWLDEAERAGVYTVLDLQPGRADFPSQAAAYEQQLRRPWVGLALDPEWRLAPGERPLTRIGSVGVEEVNATSAWLAGLVREHDLPPKVFTVHQFQPGMVRGRERLITDHDELQVLVHVDGQGSQSDKQSTWATIRAGLPPRVWLGWKNFQDEDHPMLSPEQTVAQVRPTPSFVSYQ